jgi:hypothetical protein
MPSGTAEVRAPSPRIEKLGVFSRNYDEAHEPSDTTPDPSDHSARTARRSNYPSLNKAYVRSYTPILVKIVEVHTTETVNVAEYADHRACYSRSGYKPVRYGTLKTPT